MDSDAVVILNNVSENYGVDFLIDGKIRHEEIVAVNQANLIIKKGECVALLGANGAGKSTILKLIAGMLKPDSGQVKVNGRVACLLDLGAGFDPGATGRENIFLLARLYGIKKEQIQSKLEQIIEFSGIGRFIDAPLKCYSAGMYVRLAFSLAIHVEPDILLIDDCLVVGDESFQKRCIEKIFEFRHNAKTIIFVTHDTNLASMLARRGIFLKDGRILHDGPIEKAFVYYIQMVGDINGIGALEKENLTVIFNNGKVHLNWDNLPLTKGLGGFATLQTAKGQVLSKDLHWKMAAQNKDLLTAKGVNLDLGLEQIWQVKLIDQNNIDWRIETYAALDSGFSLTNINLMLNERFNRWSTLENEGSFPQKPSLLEEWQVLADTKSDSDLSGIIGACSEGLNPRVLPAVLLEPNPNSAFKRTQVIITGLQQSARVLSLGVSTPVRQNNFSGRIKVFDNRQEFDNFFAFRQVEFIGERTIQEGNTRLFFDAGNLRLFYREFELTKASCFFSSFYTRERWFNSSQALWEFKKQDDKNFILNAHWPELKVSQIWQVSLLNELEALWRISLKAEEEIDILSFRQAILLSDQYRQWFSTYEEGDFPQEFLWQDIALENNQRKAVGVKNVDFYPGIMLDVAQDAHNSLPAIQNSDALFQSRSLYAFTLHTPQAKLSAYPAGSYDLFSGSLKIYPHAKSIQEYISANKQDKLDADFRLQVNAIQENTIQEGATKIIFDGGCLRIFYNELEVSEGPGIRTIFDVYNIRKELDSDNARWAMEKVSEKRMIFYLRWDHISCLSQKWDITVEDNTIKVLITMSSCDNINIYNEHTGLLLSRNYKQWSLETGESGEADYGFIGKTKGVAIKDNKSRLFYAKKYAQKGTLYPEIVFNSSLDKIPEIVAISLDKDNGLGMYFLKVDQREALAKTPGEYTYFKGEIALAKESQDNQARLIDTAKHTFAPSVLRPLTLSFNNGTVKLFWKNKQISKGLGVYTSLCSGQQWYDSSQAVWQIEEARPDTLRASGIWPWIPVIQSWQIKIDKRRIFLDIHNEIYREVYLPAEEANLFLTDAYTHWFAGKKQGRFYEEFSQSDLFRFRLWVSKLRGERTGVRRKLFCLPRVSFMSLANMHNAYMVVENANILGEKGRLIQYLTLNHAEAGLKKAGKYDFFKGVIELSRL